MSSDTNRDMILITRVSKFLIDKKYLKHFLPYSYISFFYKNKYETDSQWKNQTASILCKENKILKTKVKYNFNIWLVYKRGCKIINKKLGKTNNSIFDQSVLSSAWM